MISKPHYIPNNHFSSIVADLRPFIDSVSDIHSLLKGWIQDPNATSSTAYLTGWQVIFNRWKEVFPFIKHGGYIACISNSDTADLMGICLRFAGFEIKDEIVWLQKGDSVSILIARKPLKELTIVDNVLRWGTGAINIDGCRIPHNEEVKTTTRSGRGTAQVLNDQSCGFDNTKNVMASADPNGRFPANVIISEKIKELLDKQSGSSKSTIRPPTDKPLFTSNDDSEAMKWNANSEMNIPIRGFEDRGGASRFFFQTLSDGKDTLFPLSLLTYLIRLITPPNGVVMGLVPSHSLFNQACEELGFQGVIHL